MNIVLGIVIPQGISERAREIVIRQLISIIEADQVKAALMAFEVETSLLIDEENAADRQLMVNVGTEIERRVNARGHWVHDFVCDDHQCLASECGCLEERQRTHHSLCGTKLAYFDGSYCPLCEVAVLEIELELRDLLLRPFLSAETTELVAPTGV